MTTGVRLRFDKELAKLNESVWELGALAEQSVVRAMKALVDGNSELAREVMAADQEINKRRFGVEHDCYALLVTEQPVARDMRVIISALSVTNDLERIGDHGKKIARTYLRMLENPRPIPTGDIQRLSGMAVAMLERALRAYASDDVAEANAVCAADDDADALYKQTFNVILSYMLENPRLIGVGTYLIQIAHELERVADRATNIAERVIYASTGELLDLNV